MPIERREIRLTPSETTRAVDTYRRHTRGVLPAGAIRSVQVKKDGADCSVTVLVHMDEDPALIDVEVTLSQASVFEMLLRFCFEENIPLPRLGIKTVDVIGGLITLIVENENVRNSDLAEGGGRIDGAGSARAGW